MRQYIDIISEATAIGPFVLAPGFNPENYKLTDSMRDIKSWQAMTYDGESRYPKGKFAPVGYIWISKVDNTIIPISRGDEHHHGADMLRNYMRKTKVEFSLRDYVPVWGYGKNFIYYESEANDWTVVLRKFLAWGGINGTMTGANNLDGLAMTLKQFVAAKGRMTIEPGKLAPLGQHFMEIFQGLSQAIVAAHGSDKRAVIAKPFKVATEVASFLLQYTYELNLDHDQISGLAKQIRELGKSGDLQGLSEMFFGFNSVKRAIHEKLRHTDPNDRWEGARAKAFWGPDLALAVHVLGDL